MRVSRSIPVLGSCLWVARGQLPHVSLELHKLRAASVVSEKGSHILVGRYCLGSESVARHVYLCVYVENIEIISFEMELWKRCVKTLCTTSSRLGFSCMERLSRLKVRSSSVCDPIYVRDEAESQTTVTQTEEWCFGPPSERPLFWASVGNVSGDT